MKEIKAFVRPQMLDPVVDALEARPDTPGLTVSEVREWGHARGDRTPQLTERIKLELVVPDEDVDEVVRTICREARTGHRGDGKIFVSPVDRGIRIRTGERNGRAIRPSREEGVG